MKKIISLQLLVGGLVRHVTCIKENFLSGVRFPMKRSQKQVAYNGFYLQYNQLLNSTRTTPFKKDNAVKIVKAHIENFLGIFVFSAQMLGYKGDAGLDMWLPPHG